MNRRRQKQQTRLVFVFPAKFTAMPFSRHRIFPLNCVCFIQSNRFTRLPLYIQIPCIFLFFSAKIIPLERFVFLAKSRRLRECTTSERDQSDSADGWIQISHPHLPLKQSSNLFLKGFCFICHGLPDYIMEKRLDGKSCG